jgi:CheY-like chemotaxis protein
MVRMAATHLTQLLQNVIGNSLKYRKAEQTPEIEVSAARHGSEWIFTVSDNGIGFDPAYAERVFGLFKRLHGKHEYPGTGIGLALCSRVVLAYGGRMWAESQLGAGATFHFTVPAVAPKREERRPDRPTRVLLVEDNALDAKLVSMALREQKNWATETVSVGDGEAAVLYLTQPDSLQKRSRPDLVLLDINLPKLDGTEVLRTIRTTRYLLELPVFVISSSPQDVIKERVLAARVSANQYLTKPLDVDGFLALGDTLRRLYHESVAGYK